MIRHEFREYLTKDLGYTEEVILQAFGIATAECERRGYTNQLLTLEVMTRDILEGRFSQNINRCEWCGFPQKERTCEHCGCKGRREISEHLSPDLEEDVYLYFTKSVIKTLDLLFGGHDLDWEDIRDFDEWLSQLNDASDTIESLRDHAEDDRLAVTIAHMEKHSNIVVIELVDQNFVAIG